MNRREFKRTWCRLRGILAAAVLFLCFSPRASAGVSFNITSLPRIVRASGVTEVMGEVAFQGFLGGMIPAGSAIFVDFGLPITNNSTLSPNNISLANNVFCTGSGCPQAASLENATTLRLLFSQQTFFDINNAFTIHRIRLDVTAAATANLTAVIYSFSSDPANGHISFSNTFPLVGVVQSPILADFNHDTATPNPVTAFLTCTFPNDSANDFFIRVGENYLGALMTQAQESAQSPNLPPTNGTNITITFTNVPAGLTLSATGTQLTSGPLTLSPAQPQTSVDQTVANTPITFTYSVLVSNTGVFDRTTLNFSLKPTTVSTTNPLAIANVASPVNIQGIVQLTPITTNDSTIVRFANNQIGPTTVATINNCPTPNSKRTQLVSE